MSVFNSLVAVTIACYAVLFEVLATSALQRKEDESATFEKQLNNLQSSHLLLRRVVLNQNKYRIILHQNLAQETRERKLLEDRLRHLQNSMSYEKQRRTEVEEQLVKLKGEHNNWSPWGSWGNCTRLCGDGQRMRLRTCTYANATNAGQTCVGHSQDIDQCNNTACPPENGNWSPWGSWGDCTRTCGNGQRMRFRTCINANSTNAGQTCVGRSRDIVHCNNTACPTVLRHAWAILGGGRGTDVDQFDGPEGVAASPAGGRFYVVDTGNNRVKIYSDEGAFIKTFGSRGQGDEQFNQPTGLAVNSHEEIIIADRNNHRIVVYGRDGQFKYKFGKYGSNKGEFKDPWGVAVDRSDNVYICDCGNDRVQVFTRTGEFIRHFGQKERTHRKLNYPRYLAVSVSTDRVYITEAGSSNYRVSVFSSEGKSIFTFGNYGMDNGEMSGPHGIAIDEHGFVILADSYNHRVQVFHADGRFISTYGSEGTRNGQFKYPQGVAVTQRGDVIVTDFDNNRVQIFSK